MSETSMDKPANVLVVATPGYSVLLDIGGITIPIDAFTPVNLTETFTDEVVSSSFSLKENLKNGWLKLYEGETLPKDANEHLIAKLKQSPVVKLATSIAPKTELFAKPAKNELLTPEFVQDLADRVDAHSKKITQQLNAPDAEDESEPLVPGIPIPSNLLGTPLEEQVLTKPVVMDVSTEKFKEFQTKTSKHS